MKWYNDGLHIMGNYTDGGAVLYIYTHILVSARLNKAENLDDVSPKFSALRSLAETKLHLHHFILLSREIMLISKLKHDFINDLLVV